MVSFNVLKNTFLWKEFYLCCYENEKWSLFHQIMNSHWCRAYVMVLFASEHKNFENTLHPYLELWLPANKMKELHKKEANERAVYLDCVYVHVRWAIYICNHSKKNFTAFDRRRRRQRRQRRRVQLRDKFYFYLNFFSNNKLSIIVTSKRHFCLSSWKTCFFFFI